MNNTIIYKAAIEYFYLSTQWNDINLTGKKNKLGYTQPATFGKYSEYERMCQHNFDVITTLVDKITNNPEDRRLCRASSSFTKERDPFGSQLKVYEL